MVYLLLGLLVAGWFVSKTRPRLGAIMMCVAFALSTLISLALGLRGHGLLNFAFAALSGYGTWVYYQRVK